MPPPSTLEAQVVRFADRIAYINHDIDDAIRAGVLAPDELPPAALDGPRATPTPSASTRSCSDLVDTERGRPRSGCPPEVFRAIDALRDFMFEQVYLRPEAREEHEKAMQLLRDLFRYFLEHPDELPPEYHRRRATCRPAWSRTSSRA